MNVLITSANAKCRLIRLFQQAVHSLGGRVIAADVRQDVPARNTADIFVSLPYDHDETFAEALLAVCSTHDVRLVVPTRDGELARLSALKPVFADAGIVILVPDAGRLAPCLDKRAFVDAAGVAGVPVLPVLDIEGPPNLPAFARPVHGSGGQGACTLSCEEDWLSLRKNSGDFIVQPLCRAPEYSIDVLSDLVGDPLDAVVRRRVRVVNGESVETCVEKVPILDNAVMTLARYLKIPGHSVYQGFWSHDGVGPFLFEVNARFGGVSHVSVEAGLDSPRRLIQMVSVRA